MFFQCFWQLPRVTYLFYVANIHVHASNKFHRQPDFIICDALYFLFQVKKNAGCNPLNSVQDLIDCNLGLTRLIDLVFQIKPKAINGKAGWGTKDTVQRSMTWPTGFLSQVTGNLRLASRGDQRQKFFFLSFTFSCPIRRKGVLEGTTLQRGIQPSLLALYLCLLLGALTKNSVTLYKMTEDSRLILTKKQQQVLPLSSFLAFISSDVVGNYRCINQTISLWAERLRSMSVAMTTTSRLQLGGQLGYHLKDFLHDMKSWTFLFQLSCLFLGFMLFWAFFAVIILTALVELWSLSLNENIQFCA